MGKKKGKYLGVSAVEVSQNSKIGIVSATYVSQDSCWNGCPFKGHGCYAEHDLVQFTTNRVNRESTANQLNALTLAINEANAIDSLSGQLPLRLHVVGDCQTDEIASIVSAAAMRYLSKHGHKVWSYTHVWRDVARESWKNVSILASCESTADALRAMANGYAAAVVFPDAQSIPVKSAYMNVVHCPQQTGKTLNCTTCKLCWNADRLLATRTVIGFTAHGGGEAKATAILPILQ